MVENDGETGATGPDSAGKTTDSDRALAFKLWGILLICYVLLLGGTGYVAFFQPAYNPATFIDDELKEQLSEDAPEDLKRITFDALKDEGIAFKERRELALQAFNIVLGATLGFLSALAGQAVIRSRA